MIFTFAYRDFSNFDLYILLFGLGLDMDGMFESFMMEVPYRIDLSHERIKSLLQRFR